MKKLAVVSSVFVSILAFAAPAAAQGRPAPAAAPPDDTVRAPARAPRPDGFDDSGRPPSDPPPPDGFSVGARVGYALPMGSIAKDPSLNGVTDVSRYAAGMVPLWADIGYRIDEHWYVGGYFQLGVLSTAGDFCTRSAGQAACTSSGTNLRFGAMAKYTFKPQAKVSPWIGLSAGYEIMNISRTVGKSTEDDTVRGWELAGFHFGADFHPAPSFSLGPVVSASIRQYGSTSWTQQPGTTGSADFASTALHQWMSFGVRGQFDM